LPSGVNLRSLGTLLAQLVLQNLLDFFFVLEIKARLQVGHILVISAALRGALLYLAPQELLQKNLRPTSKDRVTSF
jgi:hypothetical protein